MGSNEESHLPSSCAGLSFGELLAWHLLKGTRPKSSPKIGREWSKIEFADANGISDRQVRYWLRNQSRPPDIETIERLLFGVTQTDYADCRLELRKAHKRSWSGAAPGDNLRSAGTASHPSQNITNIPIRVPEHFLGRDDVLEAIEEGLKRCEGRVAITALHGMRGVGKSTLAAAYADRQKKKYQATWWIRAQTSEGMQTDLVALGLRLAWVVADEEEETALGVVLERLRTEGKDLLLVYDNAMDDASLKPFLPRSGDVRVLVTSNYHAWRGIAKPIEIHLWPKDIGANYLIARTGRKKERKAAEELSEMLGGLPLAHEQAAAYSERLTISLREYAKRFDATPARYLDDHRHAPSEYYEGRTVAKTFTLAIEEAAKLHPAAEHLIAHAAVLPPEPIPLLLFSLRPENFCDPLASLLAEDGLDEAVAALRAFALVDRKTIADERDPSVETETIRLHRLVREVAMTRQSAGQYETLRCTLMRAMSAIYPDSNDPDTWDRCRRLDAHALALVADEREGKGEPTPDMELHTASILNGIASYRLLALAAYEQARPLNEQALAIRKRVLGPEHPDTATSINNLARLFRIQGDLARARPLYERALTIREKVLGPNHSKTATSLNDLAVLLRAQGDLTKARLLYERALTIREKVHGPVHASTATSCNNLAFLLRTQGDLAGARPLYERALTIREKVLGPNHPNTATSCNNLAFLLMAQGDLAGARPLYERALAIREKLLSPEHPNTATSLKNLAALLQAQGDFAGARPLYERALAIREKLLGPEHPDTNLCRRNLAQLLFVSGQPAKALELGELALIADNQAFGTDHARTKESARTTADALDALERTEDAAAVREKYNLS